MTKRPKTLLSLLPDQAAVRKDDGILSEKAIIPDEPSQMKIADLPKNTPMDKQDDFLQMAHCIGAYIESTLTYLESFPVGVIETGINSPTVIPHLLDTVLAENPSLIPDKMLPGWRNAPHSIRAACAHALLCIDPTGVCIPYTLRYTPQLITSAFRHPKGPATYLHERTLRYLKPFGRCFNWQFTEISPEGIHHSHGAFFLDGVALETDVKLALRKAGGKGGRRQLELEEHWIGYRTGWCTYASKDLHKSRVLYATDPYACSQELRFSAQQFYESLRCELNARRFSLAA